MWDDQPFLLAPDFENQRITEIEPLAGFIKSKLVGLYASFATADDTDEKHEIVAQMTMSTASAALLTLGYIAERPSLAEMARELMRRIQT